MAVKIPNLDIADDLKTQVKVVEANGAPVKIIGGKTREFYGNPVEGIDIDVSAHSGIIDYDPAELVITLRAGCKVKDVEALLAANNQMFGFEPPLFGDDATIGGMVASGLTGPRRAYSGAIRDFILGVKILDGRAEVVNFGGRVIKNVAGFDVSRLMVGALGTLGILLEVSIRIIPRFETELSLQFDHAQAQSHIDWINALGSLPLPLSGSYWYRGQSVLRLSGSEQGVRSAQQQLGGDEIDDGFKLWTRLREQSHDFFSHAKQLTRVSVPSAEPDFLGRDDQLIEWGGAQRWIAGNKDLENLRKVTRNHRAIVCAYRGYTNTKNRFHPPAAEIMSLHRNIKSSFDPAEIFNPGRLYAGL